MFQWFHIGTIKHDFPHFDVKWHLDKEYSRFYALRKLSIDPSPFNETQLKSEEIRQQRIWHFLCFTGKVNNPKGKKQNVNRHI